jgi:fatty-acyl-CoA synthase
MLGLMQDWPLLCHRIIDHAALNYAERPIITRSVEGDMHTTSYAQVCARALRVAQRLDRDGVRLGDRIATLAWNTWRHFEAWYGIMGIGAIYHTVNPRLFPEQIVWIVNHAQDKMMLLDLTFVPLLEKLASKLPSIERYVVLTDARHMPASSLTNVVPYEEWIGEVDGDFAWKTFDENTAAGMCYTSGTTGNPKGVLYSHRSNVLHGLMANNCDVLGVNSRDVLLPVVPMFHANTWGINFTAPISGASLVLPGPKLDGASIYELLDRYKVSCSAGVPTVWLMLLAHLAATGSKLPHLRRIVIGGSACPRAMAKAFQEQYGVEVMHAWGMTEMSPLGTVCTMKPEYAGLTGETRLDIQEKQGHAPFMVEMKITNDAGRRLPWDGRTFWTRRASSTLATWRPSTATAICTSPIGPRTSSSPAGSGFHPSISRTSRSAIPRWRKPP